MWGQWPRYIETHIVRKGIMAVSGSTAALLHDVGEGKIDVTTWDIKVSGRIIFK